jgi:O-antigen/teichoic acid export membrane protein
MGIVFRQSVKTSIITFAGAFLGALIIGLSVAFIPKQEFGFIGNLTNEAVLFVSFLGLGSGNVLMVYIHRYDNDRRKRGLLLALCLAIPMITVAILSIGYFFFKSTILRHFQAADIPLVREFYIWLPIYTALFSIMNVLELYLGTQMKVAVAAFMKEVVVRILNIALIALFAFRVIGFPVLVMGTVLIYIVPTITFLLLSMRTKNFGFSFRFRDFTRSEYREMSHFSWYHFLLAISITLMGTMDALSLPFYDHSGVSSVAVYRVAVFVITFLLIPYKAMSTSTFAVLAQAFTNSDIPKAKDIFNRSSLNILIATTGVSLLICCNLGNALSVIKTGYGELVPVFCILLIGRFVDISTGMNDAVLSITNHYKFNTYVCTGLIVVLFILLRLLVPVYGVYGAAWSSTITFILFNFAKYFFVWKKLDMQPYSVKSLLVIVAGLPALAAGYFLPHFFNALHHIYVHAVLDTALRSFAIITVYLAMLLWLQPSPDLQEYIATIKKNKRLF